MSSPLLDVTFLKPITISGRKPYTKYEIVVTSSLHNLSWYIFKRYSDFQTLNDALVALVALMNDEDPHEVVLGSLPRRRLFGGMNDEVVLERKIGLQLYSKQCLKYKSLCHQELILSFFNVPEEVKMMISTLKTYDNDRYYPIKHFTDHTLATNNKYQNKNEQQVNTLLNKLYYQKNRSFAIKNFEDWYFESFGHGYKFNPHLIRKLLIGYDKYIGLMQSCKQGGRKPSCQNALSLLVKLFCIERNKYARLFIQVFIHLKPSLYREMDLHRHIADCTTDDAFQIVSIFNIYLPHVDYRLYVNSDESYFAFLQWNEIQTTLAMEIISYFEKEEIEEKQMTNTVFDYNTYKNNPNSLINLSDVIFTKYCEFMYENDDEYRTIHKINQKYRCISLNVRIQKDFYNDHWKIKISFVSPIDAAEIYNFLRSSYIYTSKYINYGWDKKLIDRKIEKKLSDNDYIMHETYKSYNSPYRFRDFVVLRTFRGGTDQQQENKKFFIVFSSITNYDNYLSGATRCIMFPSGFEITQHGNNKSYITYRLHMTEEGINIINADLLGDCDELINSILMIASTNHTNTKHINTKHISNNSNSILSNLNQQNNQMRS